MVNKVSFIFGTRWGATFGAIRPHLIERVMAGENGLLSLGGGYSEARADCDEWLVPAYYVGDDDDPFLFIGAERLLWLLSWTDDDAAMCGSRLVR